MQTLRNLVSAAAFAGLTCVSLAAVVQVVRQGTPTTPLEDRRDTLEWLSSEDLDQAGLESQRTLIRRLEQELDQRTDWQARLEPLDQPRRERMRSNFALLAHRWFLDVVDEYHDRRESERESYLDQQLDKVERWYPVGSQIATNVADPKQELGLATIGPLLGQVQQWLTEADADQQERIREFQEALQDRVVARELERLVQPR